MTDLDLARLRTCEAALRKLGINPDNDPVNTAARWTAERDGECRERAKAEDALAGFNVRWQASQDHLAKVTTERDEARKAFLDLSANNPLRLTVNAIAARLGISPAEPGPMLAEVDRLKGLADAHAVVSQRLAGAQREIAEVTARADTAEAKAKRLRRYINAAHDVLDEAAIALEPESARRYTLARRCRAATAEVWDYLDAVNALDEIAKVVGLTPPSLSSGATDSEVVAAVKALYQPGDLPALLDRYAAPAKIGARQITTAERAAFVIRRLARAAANARAEAAALRAEQEDLRDAVAAAPDAAERADGSLLALNLSERIRAALAR